MLLIRKIRKFLCDESGATAIEYSLIAAAMALALVPAMIVFSDDVETVYNSIITAFSSAGI